MELDNYERAKQQLDRWQKENSLTLEEYEQCKTISQALRVDDDFLNSGFLLMYKIKKMKCQICHYGGRYKYFRVRNMFSDKQEEKCLVFMMCDACYESERDKLPILLDKTSYIPMNAFLKKIDVGIGSFQQESQYSESIIKKYDIFESQLTNVTGQLMKAVEKRKKLVCKKIFDQVSILREIFLNKQSQEIYEILLKSQECECRGQCCYCDFKDANEEYLKTNCKYYELKKQQNDVINKVHLLNSIKGQFEGKYEESIFGGVVKEVEMVVINHMEAIEKALVDVIRDTEDFSLLNSTFMAKIVDNYCIGPMKDVMIPHPEKYIEQSKAKYISSGVLNQFTSAHFQSFSNEITSISLNYMPDESIFRKKLKLFDKLSRIEVGCNEIGSLLVEDTIKGKRWIEGQLSSMQHSMKPLNFSYQSFEQMSVLGKEQKIKKTEKQLINLHNFKELATLSFNCKIPYKEQFLDSISDLPQLSELYLNWNYVDFFEKFNESSHFLEDKSMVNSSAPPIQQISKIYKNRAIKNIWIGNCGFPNYEENEQSVLLHREIEEYCSILDQMKQRLQGVMFGQFDGRCRMIQQPLYRCLCDCRNLKTLFFNKVELDEEMLVKVLSSNSKIEGLYFNECEGYSEAIFDSISALPCLKRLSIVQIQKIYFKRSIPTLETFILERCFNQIGTEVALVLKQAKLTCLSLYECRFIDDEILQEIINQQLANKSEISYINMGFTKLSNETLNLLNNFKQVRSLHLGGTSLNLPLLLKDISHGKLSNLRKLEKLSLKEMRQILQKFQSESSSICEYYNDLFSYILEYFPLLSHLDISGNRVINERAIRFGLEHLAYLTATDTMYSLRREKERIDHSGPDCPFINGRLGLQPIQPEGSEQANLSERSPSLKMQPKRQRREELKIIF